jgi:large subunit ribosomal protein L32
MPNPTHRHSRSRRDKRRANWKGSVPTLIDCESCGAKREPHRVCPACGTYKGRTVLVTVEKEG